MYIEEIVKIMSYRGNSNVFILHGVETGKISTPVYSQD